MPCLERKRDGKAQKCWLEDFGSRIAKQTESKASSWEGMFAIYFPLLTELLKYTKLG